MTILTLELPPTLYDRLRAEADRLGKPAEVVVQELLADQLPPVAPVPKTERERIIEVLRAAGLVAEPSPEMLERASKVTMMLEEVRAALDRSAGKPLSEIILEQRGPK